MGQIFNFLLVNPMSTALMWLNGFTGSLGLSIILLTVAIRGILVPVMNPSLKAMEKQKSLKPLLDKIKEKYPNNKQKQAEEQMKIFKEHGINPASGCLTQIIMLTVLVALYQVIRNVTTKGGINTAFLYMDLAKPDPYFVLAVLSGILQTVASKMMMPAISKAEKLAKKTPGEADDIAYNMQQQTMYFLPVMNFIFGITLPAGVMVYIVTTTIFSIIQNYFVSGWGGMKPWIDRLKFAKR